MTLSDAIRLGAMLKPQAYSDLSHHGTCALQAAAEALGMESVEANCPYVELQEAYPFLNAPGCCPACGRVYHTMAVIWHLNDHHTWTRESIAEWVDTIEHAQPTSTEAPAPETVAVLA